MVLASVVTAVFVAPRSHTMIFLPMTPFGPWIPLIIFNPFTLPFGL
jgi:hypothetical protein